MTVNLRDPVDILAESVPVSVVILFALGFTTWLAGRVVRVLDRYLNGWQDTPTTDDPDTNGPNP